MKHVEAASSPYIIHGLSRGQAYLFTIVAITADGNEGEESAAIPVRLSMTATALVTGAEHSCVLLTDGAVKCWGRNNASQLGSAVVNYSASPMAVPGVANAKAVSAAGQHSCAVLNDGSMQCWGTYGEGAAAVTFASPIVIGGVASAVSVASARDTDCALLSDATVACFSPVAVPIFSSVFGSIPVFAPRLSKAPVLAPAGVVVNGVVDAKQIAAGVDFTCALLSDGAVTCWNVDGLGSPQALPNIAGATAITARGDQACALMSAGVQCWKRTISEGIPPASLVSMEAPVVKGFAFTQVQSALNGVKALAVGPGISPSTYFAIVEGGTVQVWNALPPGVVEVPPVSSGSDSTGSIAAARPLGSDAESSPAGSSLQAIWVFQSVSGEGSFSATRSSSIILPPAVAPPTPISPPVLVTDLVNVAALANGNAHGCALLLSGDVTCWGDNQYGQLGNGKISTAFTVPVSVDDL